MLAHLFVALPKSLALSVVGSILPAAKKRFAVIEVPVIKLYVAVVPVTVGLAPQVVATPPILELLVAAGLVLAPRATVTLALPALPLAAARVVQRQVAMPHLFLDIPTMAARAVTLARL